MPSDFRLLNQQKKTLFEILVSLKFDPADFAWEECQTEDHNSNSWMAGGPLEFHVSKLVHRPSNYYIIFNGINVIYSPGTNRKVEREEHHDDWQRRYSAFRAWLHCLKAELDTHDPWETVGDERVLSNALSSMNDNRDFDQSERLEISAKLDELKRHLIEGRKLDSEQVAFVEDQFRYLRQAADRVGRKDWLVILWATLVNQAITLALTPAQTRELVGSAGTLFHWIWVGVKGLLNR